MSVLDQHTHRFLWRDVSQDSGTSTYVMTSVSFGDKTAGNIATVALRKTAEMQKDDEMMNASDTGSEDYTGMQRSQARFITYSGRKFPSRRKFLCLEGNLEGNSIHVEGN